VKIGLMLMALRMSIRFSSSWKQSLRENILSQIRKVRIIKRQMDVLNPLSDGSWNVP
jgi:hypothetical protein